MQEFGLQLYSVRDTTEKNMEDTLKKVSEMGYKFVEFAGFFDYTPDQINNWLKAYNLKCYGTHTGIDGVSDENIEKTIAYHKAIGCKNIIVPGADWSSKESFDKNIETLKKASERLKKEGMTLGYHNHSNEFFPTSYGKIVEDEIIDNTDLELEIDTFWSYNAGKDNLELLESLKDRIKVIHLKDGIATAPENRNINDCHKGVTEFSVGLGKAPIDATVDWCIKNNVRIVVESESLTPDGLSEVKRCIDYLCHNN